MVYCAGWAGAVCKLLPHQLASSPSKPKSPQDDSQSVGHIWASSLPPPAPVVIAISVSPLSPSVRRRTYSCLCLPTHRPSDPPASPLRAHTWLRVHPHPKSANGGWRRALCAISPPAGPPPPFVHLRAWLGQQSRPPSRPQQGASGLPAFVVQVPDSGLSPHPVNHVNPCTISLVLFLSSA